MTGSRGDEVSLSVNRVKAGAFAGIVADAIADRVKEGVGARGRCVVSLAGGSTPRPVYERLALVDSAAGSDAPVPWSAVHWIFGDERCVPPDDPESNYRMASHALFEGLGVDPAAIHRMRGEEDPQRAAGLYRKDLEALLGESGRIDLALLGLGEDGHTASIFPRSPALEPSAPSVLAVHAPASSPVRDRLTLTLPVLARSRTIYFLASGEAKLPAMEKLLAGDEHVPAARVALAAQAAGALMEIWWGE